MPIKLKKDRIDPTQLAKQKAKAFRGVFDTHEGHSVLRHLCRDHCIFLRIQPPLDAMSLAYREGQRAVVMGIIESLEYDPIDFEREVITTQD